MAASVLSSNSPESFSRPRLLEQCSFSSRQPEGESAEQSVGLGSAIFFRIADAGDRPRILEFLRALPFEAGFSRFFSWPVQPQIFEGQACPSLTHTILLAEIPGGHGDSAASRIVGLANCHRSPSGRLSGSMGVVVAPPVQRQGLGYRLFREGLGLLYRQGVRSMVFEYQGDNRAMAHLRCLAEGEGLLRNSQVSYQCGIVTIQATLAAAQSRPDSERQKEQGFAVVAHRTGLSAD